MRPDACAPLTRAQPACYTSISVLLLDRQQPDRKSHRREAAPFVTEQTTRFVLPSHIEAVADAAAAAADFARNCGVAEEAAFGIDMAVREAITNAIVHGNKEDDAKQVEVAFTCIANGVEIEIKDQGEGFDPVHVPDPTAAENLMKTSGRGNFLMRSFMDEVHWEARPEGGTTVRMIKRF
jgi:serine/threonine-protein kinase RsbW